MFRSIKKNVRYTLQDLVPGGGSNVLPGVLQVELSLLVPELVVRECVQVGVAEGVEELPGVVAGGQEVGVSAALVLGQLLAPLNHLAGVKEDVLVNEVHPLNTKGPAQR